MNVLLFSFAMTLVAANIQDVHANNKALFLGTVTTKGPKWQATVDTAIKGCIRKKTIEVSPNSACPLTSGSTYLFAGTSTPKAVTLNCDTLPAASILGTPDWVWLLQQADLCGKKTFCADGAKPLQCDTARICSAAALTGCVGATKCTVNPCNCSPMFFNKKGVRVCTDSCGSKPNVCGDKNKQLAGCAVANLKKAVSCVTDNCSGKPVWLDAKYKPVCSEVSQYELCADRAGVNFASGKGKAGKLGFAIVGGSCGELAGVSNQGLPVFSTLASCEATCPPRATEADLDFRRPGLPNATDNCPDGKAPYVCDLSAIQIMCANLNCGSSTADYCIPKPCQKCEVDVFDKADKALKCQYKAPEMKCPGTDKPPSCSGQPNCVARPDKCPAGLALSCIFDCKCASIWVSDDTRMAPSECAAQIVDLIVSSKTQCPANAAKEDCCQPGNFKKEDCSGTNSVWTCQTMTCPGRTISKCEANPCDSCNVWAFDDKGKQIDVSKCTLKGNEPSVCSFQGAPNCNGVKPNCGPRPSQCPNDWVLDCIVNPCTCLSEWVDNDIRYATAVCQLASTPKCVNERGIAGGFTCPKLECAPLDDSKIPPFLKQAGFTCKQNPCTCSPFWQPNLAVGGKGPAGGIAGPNSG